MGIHEIAPAREYRPALAGEESRGKEGHGKKVRWSSEEVRSEESRVEKGAGEEEFQVKQSLKDYRADFYALSGKASDATRQLALAGIAVVWIFKVQDAQNISIPRALLVPALSFVVALALDLIQYAVATLIWEGFMHYHSARGATDDFAIDAHWGWNMPANFCFVMKIVAVVSGYLFLIEFFIRAIKLSA